MTTLSYRWITADCRFPLSLVTHLIPAVRLCLQFQNAAYERLGLDSMFTPPLSVVTPLFRSRSMMAYKARSLKLKISCTADTLSVRFNIRLYPSYMFLLYPRSLEGLPIKRTELRRWGCQPIVKRILYIMNSSDYNAKSTEVEPSSKASHHV